MIVDNSVKIRYINKTFQNMFKLKHHLLKNLKKGSSFGENSENFEAELDKKVIEFMEIDFDKESEVESEINQRQVVEYLKSIQISRTDYSIKDNKVVQISDREHTIHNLFEVLSKMHDGQIFEYVLKKKEVEVEPKPMDNILSDEEKSFS